MEKISVKNKYKKNPRKITDKQMELLKSHLEELGDLSGVIYCTNNKAYVGGNQRSTIFDGADIEIVERFKKPTKNKTLAHGFINYNGEKYAYREVCFNESEFQKACLVANNDGGSFDWEKIKSWDSDLLDEWGVELPEMESKINSENNESENNYTQKIKSPVYEIKNEKPEINKLFDIEKTNKLIEEIENSSCDKEIKQFLIFAAQRHIVFNYELIADFYAHSDKETQNLMENSALIIIDINKAIEHGYVKLSDEIKEQYLNDYPDEDNE